MASFLQSAQVFLRHSVVVVVGHGDNSGKSFNGISAVNQYLKGAVRNPQWYKVKGG